MVERKNVVHVGTNAIKGDAYIDWQGQLVIGPNSCIQPQCWIEMHTHDFERDDWPVNDNPHTLTIGAHVHIGIKSIVLGKCKFIADGSLIGAGSVVTKDITEPWCKWAGNPARKIGTRKQVNTNLSNERHW